MQEKKQILIVEDSEESALYLSEILDEHGYNHAIARNGKEAMEAMKSSLPDLVLLDVMMPRKTGLGVLKDMKKDPALEKIPVIIVSGASDVTGVNLQTGEEKPKDSYDDDFARSYGEKLHEILDGIPSPDGFVEKPFEPDALVLKVRNVLGG